MQPKRLESLREIELNKGVVIGIVVLLLIVGGWWFWRGSESVYNTPAGSEDAIWQETERHANEKGIDLRKYPEYAQRYYQHHPEEKIPPEGLPTKWPSVPGDASSANGTPAASGGSETGANATVPGQEGVPAGPPGGMSPPR